MLKRERVHGKQVRPAVELGGGVEVVDELVARKVEVNDRRHGLHVVRVRRHDRLQVLQAVHGPEVVEVQAVVDFSRHAEGDQAGVGRLAGARVAGSYVSVEGDRVDQAPLPAKMS